VGGFDDDLQLKRKTRSYPDRLNKRAFRTFRSWKSLLLAARLPFSW